MSIFLCQDNMLPVDGAWNGMGASIFDTEKNEVAKNEENADKKNVEEDQKNTNKDFTYGDGWM